MEKETQGITKLKKRVSPIVLPKVLEDVPQAQKNKSLKEKKAKTENTKELTSSTAAKKETTKKTQKSQTQKTTKKPVKPKIDAKKITSTQIDPRTGMVKQKVEKKPKEVAPKPIEPVKKPTVKKPKKPMIKSKEVTIEPPKRDDTPKEIIRPSSKKERKFTKEEKVLYKQLEESFDFVANLTTVIEERTMDTKNISDLTIGELHVIEKVNEYNNKPMTLIAKKMHVTVGSLTVCVNRLVQKGYLLRTRDEMDRRVILLSITQQGKKTLKYHDKFHDDILGLVLDTIPLQQALKVMKQFADVLEMYFDPSIIDEAAKKTNKKERR